MSTSRESTNWSQPGGHRDERLMAVDPIWARLREEAREAVEREPGLASLIYASILNQPTFEAALIHRVSQRLGHADVPAVLIVQAFADMLAESTDYSSSLRTDIQAVFDRDPAVERYLEPFLYFKGFHAIQTHRLAHHLWTMGRKDFALYLQSRSSAVFQVDINPAARLGKGLFIDHGTGVVIGMTATVGDNVSILQEVTLGGTGKEHGDRHPKIGNGVLIGAGAKVLGNIRIGDCVKIASGSVVLKDVPDRSTVAGIPARIIATNNDCGEPGRAMDHCFERGSS